MVSQGSDCDSDGVPEFMQNASVQELEEGGFSSPDSEKGVGVFAKQPLSKEGLSILEKKVEMGVGIPSNSIYQLLASSSGGIPIEGGFDSSSEEFDREHTPTPAEAKLLCMLDGSLPVQSPQKPPVLLPATLKSASGSSSLKKNSRVLPRRGVPIAIKKGVPILPENVTFESPIAVPKGYNLSGIKQVPNGGERSVLVEEVDDSDDGAEVHRMISSAVKAAYASNKNERMELINARKYIMELQSVIVKNGLSVDKVCDDVEISKKDLSDSAQFISGRDELGLPIFKNQPDVCSDPLITKNQFTEKLKEKIVEEPQSRAEQIAEAIIAATEAAVKGVNKEQEKKSWLNVVKSSTSPAVVFNYCPLPQGCSVVRPTDEVLQKGVDKFKFCVIGTFTKGTWPYPKVVDLATKAWSLKGLDSVSKRDNNNFIFKFQSDAAMNSVLARGTWYFERKPLVLCAWGDTIGVKSIKSMPLWVKFANLPDYYWTPEGLSSVASVIGPPICADLLTSQMNPIPFAHMCVTYTYGNPMPGIIPVASWGGGAPVDVIVSYPFKPLSCDGCNSLGHTAGACPIVKRVWIQKEKLKVSDATINSGILKEQAPVVDPMVEESAGPVADPMVEESVGRKSSPENILDSVGKQSAPVLDKTVDQVVHQSVEDDPNSAIAMEQNEEVVAGSKEDKWTVVKKKKSATVAVILDDVSPVPLNTFKGLKNVDEVAKKKAMQAVADSVGAVADSVGTKCDNTMPLGSVTEKLTDETLVRSEGGSVLTRSQKKRARRAMGRSAPTK